MIEYGFESPLWMARAVIAQAPTPLLRKAVDELLQELWRSSEDGTPTDEIFDRLVQVSTTGRYTPSQLSATVLYSSDEEGETLSEADEKTMREFNEGLDDWIKDLNKEDDDDS